MTGPKIRALELIVPDEDDFEGDDKGLVEGAPATLRGRALASHVAGLLNSEVSGAEIARAAGYSLERCVDMLCRAGFGRLGGELAWRDYQAVNVKARGEYVTVLREAEVDEQRFAVESEWLEYLAA